MPEPSLQFVAEQQERVLAELRSLRDDMSVVAATLLRLDNRRHMSYAERCFAAEALATLARGGDRSRDFKASKEALKSLSRNEAAAALNIGKSGLEDARIIRQHGGPEIVAKVKTGELPVRRTATRLRAEQKGQAGNPASAATAAADRLEPPRLQAAERRRARHAARRRGAPARSRAAAPDAP